MKVNQFIPMLFRLLTTTPKDAIYVLLHSSSKPLFIKAYDKKSNAVAVQIIAQIKMILPSAKVHFMGSAALKIAGRGDIDIFIESSKSDLKNQVDKISAKFGRPTELTTSNAEWRLVRSGFPVEIEIIASNAYNLQSQLRIYELLTTNKKYLEQYEEIKMSLHGQPVKLYLLTRMDFFNRILKSTSNI